MKKDDCLFCKIAAGEIPSTKVYEDESCYAFEDINPMAKAHVLVIPKDHVDSLDAAEDDALLGKTMRACRMAARAKGLADTGYRVATNVGPHACQSVAHLHFHILGGEQLSGKMG